ncbi:hypothetical protein DFR49_1288 [Hephaestia caeni]|uniref:Uncharacterized protein n=1 Tax=Hephaestia caeni TaxID=645617 RepID=A0A397PKU1_9SPHN|nr:hypothetical protein [Hephaestia caeni]RIA46734.1 hypothetical protein DFR49_1288 [Hephaestia caeni]
MADYFFPTVVWPTIPVDAITPLEMMLLTQIYENEPDGDAIYFFASEGTNDCLWFNAAELREVLAGETVTPGGVAELVRDKLAALGADEEEIELDLADQGDDRIFQAIIRRCDQLDHVTITSAWTCSKMRPDGFGGGVTMVTADHILSSTTHQMEAELLDRAEYGELGCAPGHGSHVLLRLDEAEVRRAITAIAKADLPAGADASGVTDEDIRAACLQTVEATDLAVQHGSIAAVAARAAIAIARRRNA